MTMSTAQIYIGDCRDVLRALPAESVHCVVTSPPYFGLRDYGAEGQIGLEGTPEAFVQELVGVFREVRRVLRKDGTLWLNLGDSYATGGKGGGGVYMDERGEKAWGPRAGLNGWRSAPAGWKHKDLIGMPWRVALALQADGWYLRQDIIWHKPNPMPESVTDRCTKAHEYIFLLAKSSRYYYDAAAIQEEAVGGLPGNTRHKYTEAYEGGAEEHRTKSGLVAYAARSRNSFRRESSKRAHAHPGQTMGTHRPDLPDTPVTGMRNKRSVWTVATRPFADAHFATFPVDLIVPCIKAGAPEGGLVLDPFSGAGTTGLAALSLGRRYAGIEINPDYAEMSRRRIEADAPLLNQVEIISEKKAA
jgi:DNA modification methylase